VIFGSPAWGVVKWPVALMVVRRGPRPRPDSASVGSGGATGWED